MSEDSHRAKALEWIGLAAAGFEDAATYLSSIPEPEWEGPSGASEWTIRMLAGHIAGEVVWFPNVARGITQGEAPYPSSLYEDLKALSPQAMVERIRSAARELVPAIEGASDEQLEQPFDLGFTKFPLWRATFVSASEGVFHHWDTKARREPNPQIPDAWARVMAAPLTDSAGGLAHRSGVRRFPGRYLLLVDAGYGPVTVVAEDGKLSIAHGAQGKPDIAIRLTPDEYVRLLAGRLEMTGREADMLVDGDWSRVEGLTHIFGGIANGD